MWYDQLTGRLTVLRARPRRPSGGKLQGPAGNLLRRQVVWGGCDEQQRSIGSVLDPGDLPWGCHPRRDRDGGRRGAKGGSEVLPLWRGARRGGARGEVAHPLRRRRHSLPAARLDVAMNDTV